MARLPRLSVAGWPHLAEQRVHEGQALVRDEVDWQNLLATMREAARQHGVAVHAYAISSDRLQLLATPSSDDGLSLLIQAVGRRYVALYNRRHVRQGGLWQGRYRATVLDPARFLLKAMLFVEQMAWQAGEASQPDQEARSSLRHHLGMRTDPLITDHPLFWALGNTPFEREGAWRALHAEGLGREEVTQLDDAVHKAWALVGAEAIAQLEKLAGRRVQPVPRGRPRGTGLPSAD